MKIAASFLSLALLAVAQAQMEGHSVGDEVCVVGYAMDGFCIDRGTLLDASDVETLKNPELHSLHCLLDVTPCLESAFNILVPPAKDGGMYSPGYYMTDNALLVEAGRAAGSTSLGCDTCGDDGEMKMGLRLQVVGTVEESVDGKHQLTPTTVMIADDDQTECNLMMGMDEDMEMMEDVMEGMSETIVPSMDSSMAETMIETMIETATGEDVAVETSK